MSSGSLPWKAGNAKLREMDRDGALIIKLYCPKRHLQAGVVWDGADGVSLLNGSGVGPVIDATPRKHLVFCPCSAREQFFVDTARVWKTFRDRDWNRTPYKATSLTSSDVAWREPSA